MMNQIFWLNMCHPKKARFPRQFAFQSVLAGHQYKVSNQRHHSIRNYLNAQEVIQDKGWKQAELHVNEIIGIHALQLGDKIKVRSNTGNIIWKHLFILRTLL